MLWSLIITILNQIPRVISRYAVLVDADAVGSEIGCVSIPFEVAEATTA
jgi:hypothetical protein